MQSQSTGIARCAAAAVLFGATTPLASRLAQHLPAAVLAGLLYLGAAVAVAPFAARKPIDRAAARRGAGRLLVAVVAGGLVGPLAFAAGVARTPPATASLLLNVELVATALLAALFFHEHLGRQVARGVGLVTLAGVLVAWSDAPELRVGALLVVAACSCWGLDNCVTAGLDSIAPEHITLVKGVVAGTTNLVAGLALAHRPLPLAAIGGALLVGAAGYGASITLWVRGARDIGAARGQLIFASAPFVGVSVAWVALGDAVRPVEIVAVAFAVVGVAGVMRSDHEHQHHHESVTHDHEHLHGDGHHQHAHQDGADTRHSHSHTHVPQTHSHRHMPDVFHRHPHGP